MDLNSQAIRAALLGNWKEAIKINLQIINKNSKDTDALNRLGRAYMETGQKSKATLYYSKVLRQDKFNPIARKNLDLVKNSRIKNQSIGSSDPPSTAHFLEEPGLTKTVSLIRLGDPKTISSYHPGTPVHIIARGHSVSIVSTSNQYLGRLPDDLSSRMRPFLTAGNKYSAWIKSIDSGANLKIFIRETSRAPKYKNIPSFPITEKLTYAAFTPPELVHEEKPDVSTPEEQDSETRFTEGSSEFAAEE